MIRLLEEAEKKTVNHASQTVDFVSFTMLSHTQNRLDLLNKYGLTEIFTLLLSERVLNGFQRCNESTLVEQRLLFSH